VGSAGRMRGVRRRGGGGRPRVPKRGPGEGGRIGGGGGTTITSRLGVQFDFMQRLARLLARDILITFN